MSRYQPNPGGKITTRPESIWVGDSGGNRARANGADPGDLQCLELCRQEKYPWLTQLLARRPFEVVATALANKMARVACALLARGGTYRVPALVAA